ncbi:MAG: sulfatase [Planctomycetota bacterium]|jgi:arylsulfatase A-like enzyme
MMQRRDFLKLAALSLASLAPKAKASDANPNVLFIAVDDMNDWVSYLGGYVGKVHTPNFERLARRGVSFTNAHSPSTVCNPSRTAIMTGLRPSTTGVYNNGQWWRPALGDVVTMPEHFRANGYKVCGGGKIFHHTLGNNPPDLWDEYFAQVQDTAWHYDYPVPGQHVAKKGLHWPEGFPLNGIENVRLGKRPPTNYREFDWGPLDKADLEMGDGQMVKWAIDFLQKPHKKPFFLAAGIYRPHLAWYAPRKYFDLYPLEQIALPRLQQDDLDDVPPAGRAMATARRADFELVKKTGKYRQAVQAYLASISFADALVGYLLDALDSSEHSRNTIVVLWSDHGWHLGEKGAWHKRTLWERATHVPFFAAAPGVTTPGSTCRRPVNLIDLYPTLIELCGLETKPELDGLSLVPLLKDPDARWRRPSLTTHERGNHALRTERWRYIRYSDGAEELYDHQNDPNEWKNLAKDPQYASVKEEMVRWLPGNDAPGAPRKGAYRFDPETYTWTRKSRK